MKNFQEPKDIFRWKVRDDDPNAVEILGFVNRDDSKALKELTVPDEIDGKRVVAIGAGAFKDCSSLTSIHLPEGLTEIGARAFWLCSSLTSIDLPERLTTIGDGAFSCCFSLTAVALPKGLTTLGMIAFGGCPSLEMYAVSQQNQAFRSLAGALFSKDGKRLIAYPPGRRASVYAVPASAETIEDFAFNFCSSLTAINLPEGLTDIGAWSFADCFSLEEFTVSPGNQAYCALDGVLFSKDGKRLIAYPPGRRASVYAVPAATETIDSSAFYDCSSLTAIHLHEGFTEIGEAAFSDCPSLKEFIVSPQNQAFRTLDGVLVSKDGKRLVAYPPGRRAFVYDVPVATETIDAFAFHDSAALISVHLPEGVTEICEFAFCCCSSLNEVSLPESLMRIAEDAFDELSDDCVFRVPAQSYAYRWAIENGYDVKIRRRDS